ncbi:MAG: LptF/LptG family permease [Armatimonadetes bacterium]|nr:LptF/LptG family permease [Armatimonadota bacterium]
MKLLDRYLLREMLPGFLGAALTFIVLLVGHMLYMVVEVVVERGVPLPSVMRFLALKVPGAAVMALPVSALLGSALAYNRLATDGEIAPLRVAGASLWRLLVPAAVLGLVAAVVVFVLNENIAPRCEEASRRLLVEAVSRRHTLAFMPQRFLELSATAFAYPEDVDDRTDRLLKVKLFLVQGTNPPVLIEAPEAVFASSELVARRPRSYAPGWNGELAWGTLSQLRVPLTAEALYLPGEASRLRAASLQDLYHVWRQRALPGEARRAALEIHSRLAVSAAAIVFALFAAPLTLAVGRGRTLSGVALSLVVVFIYYLAMLWARLLGERGVLPPSLSAWGENLLLLALTLWLTWRSR